MSRKRFDKSPFLESVGLFKARLKEEQNILARVDEVMSLLGDAAIKLVALSHEVAGDAGPLLTATIAESSVQISGGDRNITLAPAQGVGNDSRLPCPRLESCGEILVFGHLTGHSETTLLSSFRVYLNGDVTDGTQVWTTEGGAGEFLFLVGQLLKLAIFDQQFCWPHLTDMPEHLQRIPLKEERLREESLKKPCFGFGCPLPS
jgi:hypothetical protein